jgi:hypothetical protein
MKHKRISAAALLASLMPTTSVMAHAEAATESGILAIAHYLAHAIQAIPLLPALVAAAVAAALAILRINKRES